MWSQPPKREYDSRPIEEPTPEGSGGMQYGEAATLIVMNVWFTPTPNDRRHTQNYTGLLSWRTSASQPRDRLLELRQVRTLVSRVLIK